MQKKLNGEFQSLCMRLFNSYIKQYVDCFGMSCPVFQSPSAARLLECIGAVSTLVHKVIYEIGIHTCNHRL